MLDELGIQLNENLNSLPVANDTLSKETTKQSQTVAAGALSDIDADLQARLENLRRE